MLVESTMLPLGSPAPEFSLKDTDGNTVALADLRNGKPLLVMFICNHCPFVLHLKDAIATFAREYLEKGLQIVAISSNDVEAYPQDGPELMAAFKRDAGFDFPYLYDPTQETALAYRAACTPDFFLFDQNLLLAYRGRFDAARPGNKEPITGEDLRRAADAVLIDAPVPGDQIPSAGCNIKWKSENQPDYF